MVADWADLGGPLSLILDKLVEPIHHVWFSAVCKNWYSIAMVNHQNNQLKSNNRIVLPMLMIPTTINNTKNCSLYGISSNEFYNINLPVFYNKRCYGSSHGWLATADYYGVITLFNPFKNVVSISLPLLSRSVHKVILSANPATRPHDYVVIAIYGFRQALAFIKAGEIFWNYIDYDFTNFTDVTFYKGVVYAVGQRGNIVSFNISYSENRANILNRNVVFGGSETCADKGYLVKSIEGDLWSVRRFVHFDKFVTCTRRFEVYKLEIDEKSGKLLQMLKLDNLGDNILFVGNSDSISLSASYFSNSLQRDSIYYTHDVTSPYYRPFDNGIYNVKDGSFRKHYIYKPFSHPPVWIEPQLHSA